MTKNQGFFKNKKGNVVDGLAIVVVLFVLGIIGLLLSYILHEVQPDLEETITNNESKAVMNDFVDRVPASLDNTWMVIFVLFWIGAVVMAYFADAHPIFFAFTLVLVVIILVIGGYLSNFYAEFNTDLGEGSYFPMTTYVMGHLIQFLLGIITTIILAIFAKYQTS